MNKGVAKVLKATLLVGGLTAAAVSVGCAGDTGDASDAGDDGCPGADAGCSGCPGADAGCSSDGG